MEEEEEEEEEDGSVPLGRSKTHQSWPWEKHNNHFSTNKMLF